MTSTFDISIKQQKRTFKERLFDFHESSILLGVFKLLVILILIIPIIFIAIGESLLNRLKGKENVTNFDYKENRLQTRSIKVRPFSIYDKDEYYNHLKSIYNYTDNDLKGLEELCFIEINPVIPELEKKVFTYHMTDFEDGIVLQEVNFNNTPSSSRLLFVDNKSHQTQILKELNYVYRLRFDKSGENELKCELRYPGEKQILTIKTRCPNRVDGSVSVS